MCGTVANICVLHTAGSAALRQVTFLYRGEVTQLGALGLSEWVYASGSHLCPACMEEDGGAEDV